MNFKEAYPQLMKYWDYKKNLINPEEIPCGSRKYKVFLKCEKGHSFERRPDSYKYLKEVKLNCPKCKKTKTSLTFNKAYPHLMKYWDYEKNNEIGIYPNVITGGSNKKCYFKCEKGHVSNRQINSFIRNKTQKYQCKVCTGEEFHEDFNLEKKYPEIANEWSSKNKLKANEVSYCSDRKYYWRCEHNHEWKAGVSDRTGNKYKNKEGTKCPYCWQHNKSRNELIIYSELHQFFDNVYSTHKILGKHLDIFIKDIKLCIEYDGHHWHKTKLKSDKDRNQLLEENGIKTIRVRENPLDKIETQDIEFDVINEDLFNVIIKILKFILKNYNIEKTQRNKIENYIKNNKITNESFFKKIEDTYRIKKITNKKLFESYDKSKNKLPLHYYGQGSGYKAYWKCNSCGHEERKLIRTKNNYPNCKICTKKTYKKTGYLNRNKNRKNYSIKNTHPEILCELPKDRLEELKNLNYTNVKQYFNSTCYSCGHTYKTNLWNKIGVKQPCPNCNFNIYKE